MKNSDRDHAFVAAASELNNLLQIVSGAVAALEQICRGLPDSDKPLTVVRTSVDRAAQLTEKLAAELGGTGQKILLHPALVALAPKSRVIDLRIARRILVVDDEPMALELSHRLLTEAGHVVSTARSGPEALELLSGGSQSFDLYLIDLNMPLMDGEETFLRLRAAHPSALVLLNTGFIERRRLERLIRLGLAGFLRRPYRPEELLSQVSAILASGKGSVPVVKPFNATTEFCRRILHLPRRTSPAT